MVEAGAAHGTITTKNGKQSFEMYLNGHIGTGLYPNKLKLSFDPSDPSYFAKVLNTDPGKLREAGHFLYAYWYVYPALDVPDDAEAVYLGISSWGRMNSHSGPCVQSENIGFGMVRIYNMLLSLIHI